jgi:hypothetical protein
MAETLLVYKTAIAAPDGKMYEARACGAVDTGGTWQGWIEFVPLEGGQPLRSRRETTQPNRADTIYWATGLTPVYLEGALERALEPPPAARHAAPAAALFDAPAPSPTPVHEMDAASVLDPFSVYRKGEALLRRQLAALSNWHLVNIALEYDLTNLDAAQLNAMTSQQLIETIVTGVASPNPARAR